MTSTPDRMAILEKRIRDLEAKLESQRENERLIRESRARLDMIMDTVPVGIGIFSPKGRVIMVNSEFRRIIGMAPDEDISGINVTDMYADKEERQRFLKLMEKGRTRFFETRFKRKSGEVFWGSVCSAARKAESGEIRFITTITDITRLKGVEKEKQALQAQLLQSDKLVSIGQLAAGIAHEINNPVGYVKSNLGTLKTYASDIHLWLDTSDRFIQSMAGKKTGTEDSRDRSEAAGLCQKRRDMDIAFLASDSRELIDDCMEGVEKIGKIVADLKGFAHPGKTREEPCDINDGIRSTLNILANEIKYQADVDLDLDDLPMIQGLPQQLNQVFMNILINAVQAIQERKKAQNGPWKGRIRVITRFETGNIRVAISDTGTGIEPANLEKIFDPFFTTKAVGKGTGLGMNIAYGIITKHKGTIRVESTPGKGSCFTIILPAKES
ncbi:MAG: PAS domain S-box protein [Desulfobacteraceae bacterium]|nr:MAG: PAS domain S-box protein [Desulfobacteraceae bacterium]